MYIASVVLLLFILPAASVVVEAAIHGGGLMPLIATWFVFWPVGVRLFVAGVRQVAQPQFTAQSIFNIHDPAARFIVREVGFANLAMGALGLISLPLPQWTIPAATAGGLYYGLAGLGHVLRGERNLNEHVAMITDLLIFVVLAVIVAVAF